MPWWSVVAAPVASVALAAAFLVTADAFREEQMASKLDTRFIDYPWNLSAGKKEWVERVYLEKVIVIVKPAKSSDC